MSNFLSALEAAFSTDERDLALGKFMSEWGDLEFQLLGIFYLLTGTSLKIAHTIFLTGFQSLSLLELLKALGEIRLSASEQKTLKALCKRYNKYALKRNKIIHGNWRIEENIYDNPISYNWIRICAPINPTLQNQLLDKFNQKVRAKYCFTIEQLLKISEEIKVLSKDMQQFLFLIIDSLYPNGLP